MASQSPQGDSQEVCRRFRNTGSCRFGGQCKYQHTDGEPIPVPARQCHKFEQEGSCQFGDICRFVHGASDPRCDEMGNLRMETQVCRNFRRGACSEGDKCVRRHLDDDGQDIKGQGVVENKRPQLEPVKDAEGNEACRRFYYFGVCKWGEECKHVHMANPNPEDHLPVRRNPEAKNRRRRGGRAAAPAAAAEGAVNGNAAAAAAGSNGNGRQRRRGTCKKFAEGNCAFGDKCRYRHNGAKAEGQSSPAEAAAEPAQ